MGSMEVEYETTHALSVGTIIVNIGWPWTVFDLGHRGFTSKFLKTMRDDVGLRGHHVVNQPRDFDRHYEHWPRMTSNHHSSRSLKFDIRNFENGDRYDDHDGVNGWHYDLWPWLTLNCLRSRSPAFYFEYLEYGIFAHKVGISVGNAFCPMVHRSWRYT